VGLDISNEYVTFIYKGSRSRHPEDLNPSHYKIPENLIFSSSKVLKNFYPKISPEW